MSLLNNILIKVNSGILKFEIGNDLKRRILYILYSFIFILFILNAEIIVIPFSVKYIIVIGVMVLTSALALKSNNIASSIKKNRILFFSSVIIGLSFFATGLILNVEGYIAYAIFYLIVFPWICISDIDWVLQVKYICNSGYLINISFLIISFIFAPLEESIAYSSILGNPNMLGVYMVLFVIFTLYYMHDKKHKYFQIIILSLDCVFIGLSESRVAMLSVVTVFVLYIFIFLKDKKSVLKEILLLLISIIVMWNLTIFILSNITYQQTEEQGDISVDANNEMITDENDAFTPKLEGEENVFNDKNIADNREEHLIDKIFKGITNNSRFASGRVEIWISFLKEVSIIGHRTENMEITTELDGVMTRDAHNGILQISYSAGIPAGLGLSVIFFCGIIRLVKSIFGKSLTCPEKFIIYCLFCTFILYSMVSAAYAPLYSFMSFLFWGTSVKALFVIDGKRA